MSKDDLVYLSMKNIDKPLKFFKANEHSVFCEVTWEYFLKTITQQDLKILWQIVSKIHQEILIYSAWFALYAILIVLH